MPRRGIGAVSASYDNVVSGNFVEGNNVTLEDGADVPPKDTQTTGILIWSAVTLYHLKVTNNMIFDNAVGVWFTPATIQASGLATNRFIHVATRYCRLRRRQASSR